jgi:hypothetical protein
MLAAQVRTTTAGCQPPAACRSICQSSIRTWITSSFEVAYNVGKAINRFCDFRFSRADVLRDKSWRQYFSLPLL